MHFTAYLYWDGKALLVEPNCKMDLITLRDSFCLFFFLNFRPGVRPDVRPGVRPDVRPDVRAAPVSSEEKKKTRGVRGAAAPRLNPSREGHILL